MKNYLNCGEANAILCGINRWAKSEFSENFPSEVTMSRIEEFVKNILSENDREAVRLSEIDRRVFAWFAKCSSVEKTRKEYTRALELDVDLAELANVIRGERSIAQSQLLGNK